MEQEEGHKGGVGAGGPPDEGEPEAAKGAGVTQDRVGAKVEGSSTKGGGKGEIDAGEQGTRQAREAVGSELSIMQKLLLPVAAVMSMDATDSSDGDALLKEKVGIIPRKWRDRSMSGGGGGRGAWTFIGVGVMF